MSGYSSYSRQLVTGPGFLILSLCLSVCLWVCALYMTDGLSLGAFAGWCVYGLCAYFLFAVNNSFSLFSLGKTTQSGLYMLLTSLCPGVYAIGSAHFGALLSVLMLFFLFRSYDRSDTENHLFWIFLFSAISGIISPRLLLLLPVLLAGAWAFNEMTLKGLLAILIGFFLPFWFLEAYGALQGDWQMPLRILEEAFRFHPVEWVPQTGNIVLLSLCLLLLLSYLTFHIRCIMGSKQKRYFMNFLVLISAWTLLLMYLQSDTLTILYPSHCLCMAFLYGFCLQTLPGKQSDRSLVLLVTVLLLCYALILWTARA